MDKKYKVNEVAKIFGISRQTLVYYDKIDLFKPKYINDENNYRYYTQDQFFPLRFIIILKEAGLSLDEIKKYTKTSTPEESILYLEDRERDIETKISLLEESRKAIKRKIEKLKSITEKEEELVEIIETEPKRVYKIILDEDYNFINFDKVFYEIEEKKKKYGVDGDEYIEELAKEGIETLNYMRLKTLGFIIPDDCKHIEGEQIILGGKHATIFHKGLLDDISKTYKKLITYIEKNNYEMIGDAVEIFSNIIVHLGKGEGTTGRIYIPIRKIK